jgi:hypothetical protein
MSLREFASGTRGNLRLCRLGTCHSGAIFALAVDSTGRERACERIYAPSTANAALVDILLGRETWHGSGKLIHVD